MQFFASPADWRAWLQEHHDRENEKLVGFWKTSTGKPCMTWSESVDEALCFGWIDGQGRRVDDESHTIRFTPRKRGSTWSLVNVAKVSVLEEQGRMTDAGRAAYALRTEARTGTYSHEQGEIVLDETLLRANASAWQFWARQPPGYRKIATHWVTSAKRPETRDKRMAELVADCAAGLRIRSQRR